MTQAPNSLHSQDSYDPSADPHYMSPSMLSYFKVKLEEKRRQLLKKEEEISLSLSKSPNREPDFVDQGINEELHHQDFMFQEHEDSLRHEIEDALQRIDSGEYGYCEETGEPIGVKRLEAVPEARYCLKVQQAKEQEERRLRL